MKRYNGEGQEEGYFQDDEQEAQSQEVDAIIDLQGTLLDAMELDLAEQGLNQALLITAVEVAKDFWWIFRSPAKKVRRIEKIYRKFVGLVRETIERKED
jgi:hypothetical protein